MASRLSTAPEDSVRRQVIPLRFGKLPRRDLPIGLLPACGHLPRKKTRPTPRLVEWVVIARVTRVLTASGGRPTSRLRPQSTIRPEACQGGTGRASYRNPIDTAACSTTGLQSLLTGLSEHQPSR